MTIELLPSGFHPESAGLDMSSPGSGFDFSWSPVTPYGQFLFYFIFLFKKFWSEKHLLAIYRTTKILFGDMATLHIANLM
jgi:hypothetical protein